MAEKLNILIITHQTVYPVDSGGAMTTMSYIEEMQKFHNLSILITDPFVPKPEHLAELKEKWPLVKLYCSETHEPSLKRRFVDKLKSNLIQLGVINGRSFTTEEDANYCYSTLSFSQINLLNSIIAETKFDVIEVNYLEKFPIVYALPKDILKVAVNHEPRFKRTKVQKKNGKLDANYADYLLAYQTPIENMLMNEYDAVLCLNQEDVKLVSDNIDKPVYLVPVSASWNDFSVIEPISEPITTVFFLGSGNHRPNYDAVEWYKEEIGSKVSSELGINLKVIGDWSKEKRDKLESPFIHFEGFVDDLNIFSENSIMIVPVRYGGGIRTKIQWAMSKGIPVVSTLFGHEGIPCEDGISYLQAENGEQFKKAISELLNNNNLRNTIRKQANELVREYFSPKIVVDTRTKIYKELLELKSA